MTNVLGKVVGAVVQTADGLVIVNVAGLNTPPEPMAEPKPIPLKATVPAHWTTGRTVCYRGKGSGVVKRYTVAAIRHDRTAVKLAFGYGRSARSWWAQADQVWD